MIKINICAEKDQVMDEVTTDDLKAGEIANAVYKLEQVKRDLLDIEIDGFEVSTNDSQEL